MNTIGSYGASQLHLESQLNIKLLGFVSVGLFPNHWFPLSPTYSTALEREAGFLRGPMSPFKPAQLPPTNPLLLYKGLGLIIITGSPNRRLMQVGVLMQPNWDAVGAAVSQLCSTYFHPNVCITCSYLRALLHIYIWFYRCQGPFAIN